MRVRFDDPLFFDLLTYLANIRPTEACDPSKCTILRVHFDDLLFFDLLTYLANIRPTEACDPSKFTILRVHFDDLLTITYFFDLLTYFVIICPIKACHDGPVGRYLYNNAQRAPMSVAKLKVKTFHICSDTLRLIRNLRPVYFYRLPVPATSGSTVVAAYRATSINHSLPHS